VVRDVMATDDRPGRPALIRVLLYGVPCPTCRLACWRNGFQRRWRSGGMSEERKGKEKQGSESENKGGLKDKAA
jgi:hypothetical protein